MPTLQQQLEVQADIVSFTPPHDKRLRTAFSETNGRFPTPTQVIILNSSETFLSSHVLIYFHRLMGLWMRI